MESRPISNSGSVIARFDEGEDLLASLKKLADEHGIKIGIFNLIGGLKTASFGIFKRDKKYKYATKKTDDVFEILSCQGNITLKEGETFIHAHLCFADDDGVAHGGHLMEGSIVHPFAEVVMTAFEGGIEREFDEDVGLRSLNLKK